MIKILIVDDEKPICDLIDLNLSAAGYFCKSVQDGMKAIECIEREKFDLILLDIMLPGVDGFDIMEYIRPLKIPVIFITARGDVKDRVKGLRLGAEDYLVKPFDVVELLARVEVVLRRFHKTGAQLSAGDVDVRDYKLSVLRDKVSVALQKSEVFNATIADNISWGAPYADMEEINKAADIAQATEFIKNKTDGINSVVSQGGHKT